MFNKKRLKLGFQIIFIFILLVLIVKLTPVAISKYAKEATSDASLSIALYLLDANYYTDSIELMDLTPRAAPYVYTFKVANNKDGKRSDTNLTYDLSLVMTTNMPLTYALYKNYDTNNNIILTDTTTADSYGTYFRTLTTPTETFLYTSNMENIYTLYVYFPLSYNSEDYQNLIENIEINITSKQVLN